MRHAPTDGILVGTRFKGSEFDSLDPMRALLVLVILAACGDDTIATFDPHPGTPDAGSDPDDPDLPPGAKPFTVIQDVNAAVGYCGAENATVDGVPITSAQCTTIGTKATTLIFDNDNRPARCRVGHVPEVDNLEGIYDLKLLNEVLKANGLPEVNAP